MKKRFAKLMSVLLAGAMCTGMLAGCGSGAKAGAASTSAASGSSSTEAASSTSTASASATSAAGTAKDNILSFQIGVAIDSMDPQLANDGTSFSVLSQCMEGLLTKDADGNVIKAMAADEQVSEDGLTYTFTLRDDITWSNGDPVTADDFVFAWQRLADSNLASDYQFFVQTACLENADAIVAGEADITTLGVEATDDKTLVCHLSSPCAIFDNLMTFPSFFPVSRSFYESCGGNFATSPETINCNGAFVINSYEPSAVTITAEKNADYYDADKVSLEGVEWQVMLEAQTAAMSYESGDLDVTTLTGDLIEQYQDDPAFTTVHDSYLWYVSPNMEVTGLDNENIRLALAKSVDKTAICDTLLKDGSTEADFVVPYGLGTSPDGDDFRDTAGDSYDAFTYDVAAAQEAWDAGLQELGVDSLTFDFVTEDSDSAQQVAQFIMDQWQTNLSGLTINLVVEPKKARLEDMREGNYQLGLTRWGADYADPMTYLDMFITESTTNYMNWTNADYDAAIESAKYGELALDVNARWDSLVEDEKLLADDCVLMPMYHVSVAYMINPAVTGISFYNTGANYSFKNAVIAQ